MQARTVYRALLHCYPAAFRHEYGDQMLMMFAEQLGEARRNGGWLKQATLWVSAALDALTRVEIGSGVGVTSRVKAWNVIGDEGHVADHNRIVDRTADEHFRNRAVLHDAARL